MEFLIALAFTVESILNDSIFDDLYETGLTPEEHDDIEIFARTLAYTLITDATVQFAPTHRATRFASEAVTTLDPDRVDAIYGTDVRFWAQDRFTFRLACELWPGSYISELNARLDAMNLDSIYVH